ncbi:hypothetical protein LshimejAT787_0408460 [Lyophyllum shimeji]|uniref:Uncharacterized protein n=1 Tax=Lyophyllum shimeji TaxID=47721 RepID=A0A9P3UNF7_LYOSH|nr:hypothetical protein LshimejAT787_0408460 [Lyophyllum shimeji]
MRLDARSFKPSIRLDHDDNVFCAWPSNIDVRKRETMEASGRSLLHASLPLNSGWPVARAGRNRKPPACTTVTAVPGLSSGRSTCKARGSTSGQSSVTGRVSSGPGTYSAGKFTTGIYAAERHENMFSTDKHLVMLQIEHLLSWRSIIVERLRRAKCACVPHPSPSHGNALAS